MLNIRPLEYSIKDYDHISDLSPANYWLITGCKYNKWKAFKEYKGGGYKSFYTQNCNGTPLLG